MSVWLLVCNFLLLDVAPFLSLVHVYGTITIWLRALPPHHLCLVLTFKQRLKVHLFRGSYPVLTFQLFLRSVVCLEQGLAVCCLGHVKHKID